MDIDDAFRAVGQYGRMQRQVFWSMAIPQAFIAWQHILNVFVGAAPQFECIPSKPSNNRITCPTSDETSCQRYEFADDDFTSIVSEWNLVCGSAYKSDLVQSWFMAGLLIGNLVGGVLADQKGRRGLAIAGVIGLMFFSVLAASPLTAPTYFMYIVWRVLAGICTDAYGLVSFTLPAELVSAAERGFVNFMLTVTFAVGIVTLAPLAYLIRDWRVLSLVTAAPGLVGVYYYLVIPESPRWLLTQGRTSDAEKTLNTIALVNRGSMLVKPIKLRPTGNREHSLDVSIYDILRHNILRERTLNNMFTWFVNAVVYYGLTLKAGDLGSNKYVNLALSGLIEIPAAFAALYAMERFGRRETYSFSMFCGGFLAIFITLVPSEHSFVISALALLGKIGISMSSSVCWIHAAEMYPTNIRNKALGICNISSRIGGVVCPFILALISLGWSHYLGTFYVQGIFITSAGRSHVHLDFAIFGAATLAAGYVSRSLPETVNRKIPETVHEVTCI